MLEDPAPSRLVEPSSSVLVSAADVLSAGVACEALEVEPGAEVLSSPEGVAADADADAEAAVIVPPVPVGLSSVSPAAPSSDEQAAAMRRAERARPHPAPTDLVRILSGVTADPTWVKQGPGSFADCDISGVADVQQAMGTATDKPPLPPFNRQDALAKVRMAEDAWNRCDPQGIAMAYSEYSQWRNRDEIFTGREHIRAFLGRKWELELEYRLVKELWAFGGNRIAVRFQYEWHNEAGQWFRAYGNENWEFDEHGLMRRREASINEMPIIESERRWHWDRSGPRPSDHPGLADSPA